MSTLTALNLTTINMFGRLPTDVHSSQEDRSFYSAKIVPFNTNFVAQVMTCEGSTDQHIRYIL